MITYNKATVVRFQSAMVSNFALGLPPKDGCLKIVQVTMKHDPFDAT
jgi:hypothetical protein